MSSYMAHFFLLSRTPLSSGVGLERPNLRRDPICFWRVCLSSAPNAPREISVSDGLKSSWKGKRMVDPIEYTTSLRERVEVDRRKMTIQVRELKQDYNVS